jgi:hypothetical protein
MCAKIASDQEINKEANTMIKLKDNSRTIEITMKEYRFGQLRPDWAPDFYDVGLLPMDEDSEAYIVEDVDYCIDMALDWKHARGDFQEDNDVNPDDRLVIVDDVVLD